MEIVIIALIVSVLANIALLWLLFAEKDKRMTERETNRTERERLIEDDVRKRELLAAAFDRDREKLVDKILKSRGISPINEEKPEPKPFVIESVLTRKAKTLEALRTPELPESVREKL